MQKIQTTGGIGLSGFGIILMVVGWVVENTTSYTSIGAVIFTIGFWLLVISLSIVGIIIGVAIIIILLSK